MAMNRKYWKGMDELNETPSFIENRDQEFVRDTNTVEEFLGDDKLEETSTGRRDFLKFLGFSVAAATVAACEAPVVKAVPYVNKPEDIVPGKANWYASTYYDGISYANILVKTREGRPIHIKGNREQGLTKGGVNPQILASVLSLYDGERLQHAMKEGEGIETASADREIISELEKIKSKGGKVVLVSKTIASPSTYGVINEFKNFITGGSTPQVNDELSDSGEELNVEETQPQAGASFDHIEYDAVSYSAIRKANKASFGKNIIPDYDLSKAKTIVSFSADFLSSWLLPTQFTGQYQSRRNPDGDWMSKHYQFESNMSITGSNADERFMLKPSEEAAVIAALIKACGGNVSGVDSTLPAYVSDEDIKRVAGDLKKGGVVVAGANNVGIQLLVNQLNDLIGAYNETINLNNPIHLYKSNDDKMMALVKNITSGKAPDAVIFYGVNPVYTAPKGKAIAEALDKVKLSVSFAQYADETASKCKYIIPDHHTLEAWNDYSPKANEYAIAQPTIRPLFDTCAAQETLLVWSGKGRRQGKDSTVFYEYMQNTWQKNGYDETAFADFMTYWNTTIHNSAISMPAKSPSKHEFNSSALSGVAKSLPKGGDLEVVLYQKAGIGAGEQANNPWLQEMPDPISKVTWDNYITMNPETMEKEGYNLRLDQEHGATLAEITVGDESFELPVYPSPGQAQGTVGVALGYGRGENGEKIGKAAYHTKEYGGYDTDDNGNRRKIGENAFRFIQTDSGTMEYTAVASLTNKNEEYPIATTQIHQTVMGRSSVVKETTFSIYKNSGVEAYNPPHELMKIDENGEHVYAPLEEFDLWEKHPVEHIGHRWGMTIDLSSCIGCGACLIACQSENNVPVVGKDEVRRGREMHWLRLDRYYASDEEAAVGQRNDADTFDFGKAEKPAMNPKVVHQPMMCQHCNHAPCETVCPVAATTHSNEGLNQMTYNRCIGTRYCANNCPYKVRRFNWFNYPSYKKFAEVNPAQDDLGRMVLNPDVTVRTRGVMEKCSFCVQKIQEGKLTAKVESRPVKDGDVTTACADACPTNAITVGDWNDVNSAVRKSSEDNRSYQALEEIGVKPNVWYKVKVRNESNERLAEIQADAEKYYHQTRSHGHDDHHGDEEHKH
jgi:molybdopterin-containing oxidoreductase family iron-sulfur binding subunit